MEKILFVDDDQLYSETAIEALEMINPQYKVISATDGIEALEILKNKKIDLIISDIQMPVMNGIEFLSKVREKYPKIPIILITAFGTKSLKTKAAELGALYFFEKSMNFVELAKKIDQAISKGTQGYLKGIPLPTFLQLIGIEKKSCTVEIKNGNETGFLYINEGVIFDAETELYSGEDACFEIISWEEPELVIKYAMQNRKQTVFNSINHIIMEALRIKDESSQNGEIIEKEVKKTSVKNKIIIPQNISLNTYQIKLINEKFKELSVIQDFCGGCVFSQRGEKIAIIDHTKSNVNLLEICKLALNFFTIIRENSFDLGTGIGKMIHIKTENSNILTKSIQIELKDARGKKIELTLILIIVLQSGTNIGLANLKISSIARDINKTLKNST